MSKRNAYDTPPKPNVLIKVLLVAAIYAVLGWLIIDYLASLS